jgi:hypothetical protein
MVFFGRRITRYTVGYIRCIETVLAKPMCGPCTVLLVLSALVFALEQLQVASCVWIIKCIATYHCRDTWFPRLPEPYTKGCLIARYASMAGNLLGSLSTRLYSSAVGGDVEKKGVWKNETLRFLVWKGAIEVGQGGRCTDMLLLHLCPNSAHQSILS